MPNDIRTAIATDIPQLRERAPLEFDQDIGRGDVWIFAPLIAAAVTLPLIAAALFGLTIWHVASGEPSFTLSQPAAFASRWPTREMPQVVVR